MTLTLTLTPERETTLEALARTAGVTLDEYVQGVIDRIGAPASIPRTGADLLALWEQEGALLPAADTLDAPAMARQIREQAQRRS